jgi:hypothetical protein
MNVATSSSSSTRPFKDEYPLLQRVLLDPSWLDTLGPPDMDVLVEEIARALLHCCVSESTLSHEAIDVHICLVRAIAKVDESFYERADGAMLKFFRKSITTPDNLEALLRIVDADVRTGPVRCLALTELFKISQSGPIWSSKLKDGSSFSSRSYNTYAKLLDDEATKDIHHIEHCECIRIAWNLLGAGLKSTKDKPAIILDRILPFNWTVIMDSTLQKSRGESADTIDNTVEHRLITVLTDVAHDVLNLEPESAQAKEFMEKLGACHKLFRRTLRQILELRTLSRQTPEDLLLNSSGVLENLLWMSNFFDCFIPCVARCPPLDPETDVLVGLANHTLREIRPIVGSMIAQNIIDFSIDEYDAMSGFTDPDWWVKFKSMSNQQLIHKLYSPREHHDAASLKKKAKGERKYIKKAMQKSWEEQHGKDEMCASCFVLEKDAPGGKLFRCGWCHRVDYCSRECQKKHWSKTHKKQCTGRKK